MTAKVILDSFFAFSHYQKLHNIHVQSLTRIFAIIWDSVKRTAQESVSDSLIVSNSFIF